MTVSESESITYIGWYFSTFNEHQSLSPWELTVRSWSQVLEDSVLQVLEWGLYSCETDAVVFKGATERKYA